jgi:hypothetical protein
MKTARFNNNFLLQKDTTLRIHGQMTRAIVSRDNQVYQNQSENENEQFAEIERRINIDLFRFMK